MKPDIKELRNKYMDYFLNEDDPFDDLFGEEGFYIF